MMWRQWRTDDRSQRVLALLQIVFCMMIAFQRATAQESARPASFADREAIEALNIDAERLFNAAIESLDTQPTQARARFSEAARTWMQILDHEIENGRLHYNIANAYLLAGDIPEAILHFRRAERFLSGHANLATNLAIARSRVETKFEYSQANEFVRVALFWHYDLSPAIRFQLMIWSFVACWIWLLVRIQARFSNQPAWPAALALIFALCMFSSLWYESRIEWAADEAVVMIEATGRTGPSQIGYAPSLSQPLAPGVEVVILEQRADWALVRLADGRTTWLPGVALEPI